MIRRTVLAALLTGIAYSTFGCAAPQPQQPVKPDADRHPPRADAASPVGSVDSEATNSEKIAADPLAYLKHVAAKTEALPQYTLTMTRTERRGLFRQLKGPERIACQFRRQPFSVHMRWLDPNVKYGESTYVEGQQDNMVRFVPRHGLFGLPPGVTRVDLQTPVTWGEARRPLSDFGLERLMDRTLSALQEAGSKVTIEYLGLEQLARMSGDGTRRVHHFRFRYAPGASDTPEVHFYADAATDLPVRTRLLSAGDELDGEYDYDDLNTQVTLRDDDFVLDAERPEPRPVQATESGR